MNKKILIQISLMCLLILVTVMFYYKYFTDNNSSNIVKDTNTLNTKTDNLIEDLKYFSKDIEGNKYLLQAKTGTSDKENPNLIYLEDVKANINLNDKSEIFVTSKKAIYNNVTFDTKFSGNVLITYENQLINCDIMDAKLSENIALMSGNITYKNEFSKFYADLIEFDLLKKSTKISMLDKNKKVKINYKKMALIKKFRIKGFKK